MYLESKTKRVILAILIISTLILLSSYLGTALYTHRSVVIDFAIALYAQKQLDDPIPFEVDRYLYTRDFLLGNFGMGSNSQWLLDNTRQIVPYMVYEGLTGKGKYPEVVIFVPELGYRSLHVSGYVKPFDGWVFLNEKHILEWNDQSSALSTLVHELVHLQGGWFISNGGPEEFEPRTVAATVEILAGMCNYGNEIACQAFWGDVRYLAVTSFRYQMHKYGLSNLYDVIGKTFFIRGDREVVQRARDKAARYWETNQDDYWYLIRAYGVKPWHIVVDGLNNIDLDTGIAEWDVPGRKVKFLSVIFDDTEYLLGWLSYLIKIYQE